MLSYIHHARDVSLGTLADNFKRTLDPTGSGLNPKTWNTDDVKPFRFQHRLQKVSVWNLTGRALSLTVFDDLE